MTQHHIGARLHSFYASLTERQRTRSREIIAAPREWDAVVAAAKASDDAASAAALASLQRVFKHRQSADFFSAGAKIMMLSGVLGADKSQTFMMLLE